MTKEQKAEAYDRAAKEVKDFFEGKQKMYSDVEQTLEYLFPELKESEDADEKVRKALIKLVTNHASMDLFIEYDIHLDEALSWLEKQGEQKLTEVRTTGYWNVQDIEQKPTDKIEPKFKVGDWITDGNITIQIEAIKNDCYLYCGDCALYSIKIADKVYHLWTIQDAKDGDVLVCESGWTCIFKTLVNEETFSSYCFMDKTKWFCESRSECHTLKEDYNGKIYPATKEQRDTFFARMKDTGYEWDADKKELIKIEQKPSWSKEDEKMYRGLHNLIYSTPYCDSRKEFSDWFQSLKERVLPKQEQEWSEEDEKCIRLSTDIIDSALRAGFCVQLDRDRCVDWLKSLKDRVLPQSKQEWGKEDMEMIRLLVAIFEVNYPNGFYKVNPTGTTNMQGIHSSEIIKWLKSLRPQPKQEWSEEDKLHFSHILETLEYVKGCKSEYNKIEVIKSDIDWLKKQGKYKIQPKFKIGDIIRFKGNKTLKGETETHKIISYDNELYVFDDGTTDLFCEQDLYELVEQKPTDKVEPKFKVGDWLIYNTPSRNPDICIVTEITDDLCKNRKIGEDRIRDNSIEFVNRNYRLWTIQDAKDGDVLCCNQIIILFKHWEFDTDYNFVIAHAGIDVSGKLQITDFHWLISNESKPATKEQRDLLFQKMKEAGYEWDSEKLKLKKVELSIAWSKEDENNILFLTSIIEECFKDKEKITLCGDTVCANFTKENVIDRLKSLRPQNRWKPSDEQMNALDSTLQYGQISTDSKEQLNSLFNDLKKLREE